MATHNIRVDMLKVIIVVMLSITIYGNSWSIKNIPSVSTLLIELSRLTPKQKEVMLQSYAMGEPYDLGLTLTAIGWQESNFGMRKLDLSSSKTIYNSYGVFHILLKTAMKRYHIKDNRWEISRLAETLIFDDKVNGTNAIAELTFWKRYWGLKKVNRVWSHMVASYFNGTASLNTDGGKYYRTYISRRIRAVKIYMKEQIKE